MTREEPSFAPERELVERPEHGGRLLARLRESATEGAVYELALATPGEHWEARASVAQDDGHISAFEWQPAGSPPAWLVQATHAVLRSAWQRRRAGHPWPRRVARWRPAPDEAAE